jgi:hypothetical protein
MLFVWLQQWQACERCLGLRHDSREQGLKMSPHPGDGRSIKQVGAVIKPATQALRCLGEVEPHIKVDRLRGNLEGVDAQPRQCWGLPRGILEHEEHLKQRSTTQIARRLQCLQQLLKGHILMAVGSQSHLTHALQEFPKTRIAGKVGTQDEGVDEKANQPFGFDAVAVRDERTHHDIVLIGVAV